jgi:hypothetical protein
VINIDFFIESFKQKIVLSWEVCPKFGTPTLENEQTVSCSHYKRLISGGVPLSIFDWLTTNSLTGLIYKTLRKCSAEFRKYLILDGTQWRGEKCVHLLTLCIVHHGQLYPFIGIAKQKGDILPRRPMSIHRSQRYQLSGKPYWQTGI